MGVGLSTDHFLALQMLPELSTMSWPPLHVPLITLGSSVSPGQAAVLMVVLPSPAGDGAQPVAAVAPTVLSVQQGQQAQFRCTATGNPTPAIEWTGGTSHECFWDFWDFGKRTDRECWFVPGGPGNKMSPRALIQGGVLTFTSVDAADQGEYSCKALNTHGEHTARAALLVQSTFHTCWCWRLTEGVSLKSLCPVSESGARGPGTQPQVQVSPQNIEVHEGDTLRLYCRATGSPTPKLTWLKNGGQMPPQVRPAGSPTCTGEVFTWRCCTLVHGASVDLHDAVEMTLLTISPLLVSSLFYSLCLRSVPPFDVVFASGRSLSRFPSV